MGWLGDFATGLVSPITAIGGKLIDAKSKRDERKDRIAEATVVAEISRIEAYAKGDASADLAAVNNMKFSWKDEYLTVVFSLPMLLTFAEAIYNGGKMEDGWKALAIAPDWYSWCLIGIVIATFGLRTWAARTRGGNSSGLTK